MHDLIRIRRHRASQQINGTPTPIYVGTGYNRFMLKIIPHRASREKRSLAAVRSKVPSIRINSESLRLPQEAQRVQKTSRKIFERMTA